MSDIPEDIRRDAAALVAAWAPPSSRRSTDALADAIARALLAERERWEARVQDKSEQLCTWFNVVARHCEQHHDRQTFERIARDAGWYDEEPSHE